MLKAFRQIGGFVLLFAALGVGFGAWMALSTALGESQRLKGVCFAIGGGAAALLDIAWRSSESKKLDRETIFSRKYGARIMRDPAVPGWIFGIALAVCGLYLAINGEY